MAAAVADELPRVLGLLAVPAVERTDLEQARAELGLAGAPASRAAGIRLAESLGASRLVTGTYELTPAGVALSLRLLDVERATLSVPLVAAGAVDTLPDLVRNLAWDVALSGPTPPGRTR